MSKVNSHCPYCGEKALVVGMTVYLSVDVGDEGYDWRDGDVSDSEIHEMHCYKCRKEVLVDWLEAELCRECGCALDLLLSEDLPVCECKGGRFDDG